MPQWAFKILELLPKAQKADLLQEKIWDIQYQAYRKGIERVKE